ncbi:MAG TPA: cupredoxin domain-containing protein [Rhizomicrobium sp.]|nr:cupredoxin domain-containing protein [Rhizomicrobium sp.]
MRSAFAAFVLFLLSGLSANAADTIVTIKNFDFAMDVSVTSGSTVTWKNLDGEPHTVVSADGLFRSPALDQNDSYSFKFDKPGIYKYICSIHPKMRAMITVK